MTDTINWGILGTAHIAVEQLIPAMLQSERSKIIGIASRSLEKAKNIALEFGIPESYGSYTELLDDRQIQAIYIPLPNHLHVEWAVKALRAGKHILVEKPIALNVEEAKMLLGEAKKHPELKVMEAFMYKFHPQWIKAKQLVQQNAIGSLNTIESSFSFYEVDPNSIVNNKEFGGGSLMDVGCYPVSISRFLFDAEPKRVISIQEYHPEFEVDIHTSGILEFEKGRCLFYSSIQLFENQRVKLFGTDGSIEFEIPFNPYNDKPVKIILVTKNGREEYVFDACNQYSLQVDAFSQSILQNKALPVTLEDAVKNMMVIDALKESAFLGQAIHL